MNEFTTLYKGGSYFRVYECLILLTSRPISAFAYFAFLPFFIRSFTQSRPHSFPRYRRMGLVVSRSLANGAPRIGGTHRGSHRGYDASRKFIDSSKGSNGGSNRGSSIHRAVAQVRRCVAQGVRSYAEDLVGPLLRHHFAALVVLGPPASLACCFFSRAFLAYSLALAFF